MTTGLNEVCEFSRTEISSFVESGYFDNRVECIGFLRHRNTYYNLKEELYAVVNSADDEDSDDEYCEGGCGKKEIWDASEKNMCKDCDEGDKKWFVSGEAYIYDDDGEPDDCIADILYSGDEKTAREKFTKWVDENHELVAAGKGEEMEYQRLEIGWETNDEEEYVEFASWASKHNNYSFDASY